MKTEANITTIIGIDLMGSSGWLGDEIGFVFVMVLWTCITGYLVWNINKQAFEFETENPLKKSGNLGFLICFGAIYSLLFIALPVWLSQDPFNLDIVGEFIVVLLALTILILLIFTYKITKREILKKPTRRLVFLMRISLIHLWFLGILVSLAVLFIISITLGGGVGISV
jgi:hypothetical protein